MSMGLLLVFKKSFLGYFPQQKEWDNYFASKVGTLQIWKVDAPIYKGTQQLSNSTGMDAILQEWMLFYKGGLK